MTDGVGDPHHDVMRLSEPGIDSGALLIEPNIVDEQFTAVFLGGKQSFGVGNHHDFIQRLLERECGCCVWLGQFENVECILALDNADGLQPASQPVRIDFGAWSNWNWFTRSPDQVLKTWA
ncbi:hypothetical protein [Vibrio sp. CAU 1672]|uniref:hypothetical protein n=1 Tax=Vibrio sp. CAU 1672 TaxID=3032594 RepID=UPI0023DB5237|nr:hypothetical protein [Vibrio sp. CAU 1672]MDF2154617.1 hypothetical protein [Vibrio sp. CAU 1672]